MATKSKSNAERVLASLGSAGDATSLEMGQRLKIHRNTADYNLCMLHADEQVHICGWKFKGGHWGKVWRLGYGEDEDPPTKISRTVIPKRDKLAPLIARCAAMPRDPFDHMVAQLCYSKPSNSAKVQSLKKTQSRPSRTSRSKVGKSAVSMA